MPDLPEKHVNAFDPFDPRMQTENIAFRADEMSACDACGRVNPPTRISCLYCGGSIKVNTENASSIRLTLRKPEPWERGFNVIVQSHSGQPEIAKISAYLGADPDNVLSIIDAGSPLPIVRSESEAEAEVIVSGLANFGLHCSVVSDALLDPDKLPVRLSNIEFQQEGIAATAFNTREVTVIDDLALIVPGVLTSSKVDSLEKKGRGGKIKLLNETATASDESVLDIYSRRDPLGFRIHLAGFDFSCLGADKGMLAAENMRLLVIALKESMPQAKLAADYFKVRHAIGISWEIESRKDPQGLQRSGFGKVEFGSVASTSNLRQFTKYSRLQWQLLKG